MIDARCFIYKCRKKKKQTKKKKRKEKKVMKNKPVILKYRAIFDVT